MLVNHVRNIYIEGYENRLRLNLNCFNSTHLEANWTGPADSTRRLYLDCQTTNEVMLTKYYLEISCVTD